MALNRKNVPQAGGGVPQDLIEIGNHVARVAQVLDLGLQPRKAWNKEAKKPAYQFWITYELCNEFMKDEDGTDVLDKPRWISEKINIFSRSQENATSTARMNAFDPTGEWGDDWSKVLAEPCTVTAVRDKTNKYTNVGAISPPMRGMVVPELQNEPKMFDIDEPDMAIFNDLPQFLQNMMTSNLEFKGSALEASIVGKAVPKRAPMQASHAQDVDAPIEDDGRPY